MKERSVNQGGDKMTTNDEIKEIGECIYNVQFHQFYAVYAERYNHRHVGYVQEKYALMQKDTAEYLYSHHKEFADVLKHYLNCREMPKFGKIENMRTVALLNEALGN